MRKSVSPARRDVDAFAEPAHVAGADLEPFDRDVAVPEVNHPTDARARSARVWPARAGDEQRIRRRAADRRIEAGPAGEGRPAAPRLEHDDDALTRWRALQGARFSLLDVPMPWSADAGLSPVFESLPLAPNRRRSRAHSRPRCQACRSSTDQPSASVFAVTGGPASYSSNGSTPASSGGSRHGGPASAPPPPVACPSGLSPPPVPSRPPPPLAPEAVDAPPLPLDELELPQAIATLTRAPNNTAAVRWRVRTLQWSHASAAAIKATVAHAWARRRTQGGCAQLGL